MKVLSGDIRSQHEAVHLTHNNLENQVVFLDDFCKPN